MKPPSETKKNIEFSLRNIKLACRIGGSGGVDEKNVVFLQ
nr:MAG TPA: hypothetical protein [Caudoviricetes sp.]